MHFKIAKSAQSYFNNIMNLEGSHAAEDKNKFIQFDVYYCCALIGMAAGQIDEETSELKDLPRKDVCPVHFGQTLCLEHNRGSSNQPFNGN